MNYLQDHLDRVMPRVQSNSDRYNKAVSGPNEVFELRTIICSLPRQYGATTAIAEIFHSRSDMFVGLNLRMVKEFTNILGHNDYLYSTLNTTNDDGLRGRSKLPHIKRVFIDCSCAAFLGHSGRTKLLRRTIKMIDKALHIMGNTNAIYVVV